ncbi:hypothetical protein B9Z55_015979 [Caenorhabditis nigoni]|uniref:Uncharacterized protein n=1 Tax=Caenorhabditis nigoni TaxID=1611254 RepID=A0A2G5UCR2_9PELO|nr:hypothetical protein B9Z55_015979 [Caenorhabditis nigoni]
MIGGQVTAPLFPSLKTRSNTPDYRLLFHSMLTARVACFSETAVSTYGKFLRQQVEERLECWTSGTVRKKKIDVLKKAKEAAVEVKKVIKNRKKASETTKSLVQQKPSIKYQFKHFSSLSIHFFIICPYLICTFTVDPFFVDFIQ